MMEESMGQLSLEKEEVDRYTLSTLCRPVSQVEHEDRAIDSGERQLPETPCLYNTTKTSSSLELSALTKVYAKGPKGSVSKEDPFRRDSCPSETCPPKVINFVDLDNKGTLYRTEEERKQRNKNKKNKRKKKAGPGTGVQESDFAMQLCREKEENLKQTGFNNYYSCNLDKDHLNTVVARLLKTLNVFREVEVGKEKNAADSKMLADIVKLHYREDKDVGFNIVSGDRGFEVIRPELHDRKVQHLSLHERHNQNDISIRTVIGGPTEGSRNMYRTDLGKHISELTRSKDTTKVYFVHAPPPGNLPATLEIYLQDPCSTMLVFKMEKEEKEPYLELDCQWFNKYRDRIWMYETDKEKKLDAPLFLLEYAALAFHHEADLNKETEFNIITKEENAFTQEIVNSCDGRKVHVEFLPQIWQE